MTGESLREQVARIRYERAARHMGWRQPWQELSAESRRWWLPEPSPARKVAKP